MSWENLEEVFSGLPQAADGAADFRERFTKEALSWLSKRPEVREAYRLAFATGRERAAGRVPSSYTSRCICRNCGLVAIWPGVPAHVEGCPWCLHRSGGGDA